MQFQVPTITCGHCARTITRALQSIDAQARIDVDIASKLVTVDGALSAEQVVAALAAHDYVATPLATPSTDEAPSAGRCCGSCRV